MKIDDRYYPEIKEAAQREPNLETQEGRHSAQMSMPTNPQGGRQNPCPDFTKLPPKAIRAVTKCLDHGAKTHADPDGTNWRKITPREHIAHAISHLYLYLDNDPTEPHLTNAATRLLMALDQDLRSIGAIEEPPK